MHDPFNQSIEPYINVEPKAPERVWERADPPLPIFKWAFWGYCLKCNTLIDRAGDSDIPNPGPLICFECDKKETNENHHFTRR